MVVNAAVAAWIVLDKGCDGGWGEESKCLVVKNKRRKDQSQSAGGGRAYMQKSWEPTERSTRRLHCLLRVAAFRDSSVLLLWQQCHAGFLLVGATGACMLHVGGKQACRADRRYGKEVSLPRAETETTSGRWYMHCL